MLKIVIEAGQPGRGSVKQLGLHGLVEALGEGAGEEPVRLDVDGLESRGALLHRQLAIHEHVVIQDEFDLAVLDVSPLDQAGTRVELHAAAAGDGQLNVLTGPGKILLQTMPVSGMAQILIPYMPTSSSN